MYVGGRLRRGVGLQRLGAGLCRLVALGLLRGLRGEEVVGVQRGRARVRAREPRLLLTRIKGCFVDDREVTTHSSACP